MERRERRSHAARKRVRTTARRLRCAAPVTRLESRGITQCASATHKTNRLWRRTNRPWHCPWHRLPRGSCTSASLHPRWQPTSALSLKTLKVGIAEMPSVEPSSRTSSTLNLVKMVVAPLYSSLILAYTGAAALLQWAPRGVGMNHHLARSRRLAQRRVPLVQAMQRLDVAAVVRPAHDAAALRVCSGGDGCGGTVAKRRGAHHGWRAWYCL